LFPISNPEKGSIFYKNEVRFSDLDHPSIIKILGFNDKICYIQDGKKTDASYIVMEFAPYRDLCMVLMENEEIFGFDEILVRTYFHQLIRGLKYLHSKKVRHLDIKLDNLFLGENYQLKIGDFDNSQRENETIFSRGSLFYRAPELAKSKCQNPEKADIYSAGVVLFVMKCGGFFPHTENELFEGFNLFNILNTDLKQFWRIHVKFQDKSEQAFSGPFRKLIEKMLANKVEERYSLKEVEETEWFNGITYSEEQLNVIMKNLLAAKDTSTGSI